MLTIASSLKCGPNDYTKIGSDALYNKLEKNPVAFEILKDCNVKPYYDFDWEWRENDVATKELCTNFIYKFIKSQYKSLGLGCGAAIMRRWITVDSGNTKLSLHFILNSGGVYSSGLDFYHFKNDKIKFIQAFEAKFECDITDVFVVGKDLFDQSVYKSRNQQQKFGLVMSRKQPGGPIFEPIDVKGKVVDISDNYECYFVTECDADVQISAPCCELPDAPVSKKEMTKLRRDHTMKDVKRTATSKDTYNMKSVNPTLEDVIALMNEIKVVDPKAILSTNVWHNIVSCGFGTVRAYDLNERKYIDLCCEWSKCPQYPEQKTRKYINDYTKLDKFFTFDDLLDTYTTFTGKCVTANGAALVVKSLKKIIAPEDYKKVTVVKSDKTVTTSDKYVTKLASPTLDIVMLIMNEIKAADPSYVEVRETWFKLISAGLGSVRTHDLDEDAYIDFCSEWCVCEKYPDVKANWKEVYKIASGAKKVTSTFGELVKIYKDVTGKNIKIQGDSDTLYDIQPDEVIPTYYSDITMRQFTTAREFAIFLCGCVFSFATEGQSIQVRSQKKGIESVKISETIGHKSVALGFTQIQHGTDVLTYHKVFTGLLRSDYYRQNNFFTGIGFYPYSPLKPITTKELNLFNGFKWDVDRSIIGEECRLYNYFHENFTCAAESDYALNWVAACLQNPKLRPTVMILYSAEQGTGKSTMQEIIAKLFDGYALPVSDMKRDILGNFNGQMNNKLIINCSEVQSTDGGQKMSISQNEVLKTLITESKMLINEKNVKPYTVDFYGKFIVSCNYADAIRITKDDRRFSILDFGARNKGNDDYFTSIKDDINDEYQMKLLFNKLLFHDTSSFKASVPITNTEVTQIAYKTNLPVAFKFLYNFVSVERICMSGFLPTNNKIDYENGTFQVRSSDLYSSYKSYCYDTGTAHVQSLVAFGKVISSLKLKDGTPACETKKSNGNSVRSFDREDVKKAIMLSLGGCNEEMLEDMLI